MYWLELLISLFLLTLLSIFLWKCCELILPPNAVIDGSSVPIRDRSMASHDFVEDVVCQETEIAENSMKVCDLGPDGDKVLVIKQNGVISALGTKCTHYGAPLVSGALGDGRVRCPWHGACFNIKTGDIEDFPGLDSLPCYEVKLVEGQVKVRANKSDLKTNKRLKEMCSRDPNNNNVFIIIGGGPAGQICAETLRQEGFSGRLILITADNYPPYDRIKLSKQLDVNIENIKLRPDNFYKCHDIELLLSTEVTDLDVGNNLLTLNNNQKLNYNSLFIATGSIPLKLNIPGSELTNVFTLRTMSDANAINNSLMPNSSVVIWGSSFIGMEVAAYCISKCKEGSVTVIGRSPVPFAESLGKELGSRILKLFTDKGVKFINETSISRIEGKDDKVTQVILNDDSVVPADVVILGLGIKFATDFLKETGINLNDNGSVPVNQFLETNCTRIFAGGDIADAPVFAAKNINHTIGHWGLAHYHGKIAALNMMSITTPLKTVPFFWTMLFGTSIRYAGYAVNIDDVIVISENEDFTFVAYFYDNDEIVAVASAGPIPVVARYAEFRNSGKILKKNEIVNNPELDMSKMDVKKLPTTRMLSEEGMAADDKMEGAEWNAVDVDVEKLPTTRMLSEEEMDNDAD